MSKSVKAIVYILGAAITVIVGMALQSMFDRFNTQDDRLITLERNASAWEALSDQEQRIKENEVNTRANEKVLGILLQAHAINLAALDHPQAEAEVTPIKLPVRSGVKRPSPKDLRNQYEQRTRAKK